MGRQNEFYKKIHPEQFSDSVLVKKGELGPRYVRLLS